ncbi:unnamed protein product [Urochloa humidicola]
MDAISCLAPPPAALLGLAGSSSTSFADAAIARALHYSISDSGASCSSSLSAAAAYEHNYSPLLATADFQIPHAATTCDSSVLLVAGRRQQNKQQLLAPAGGRAGKRRSRASKRAPTTYISTDPTNFRIMVQHITGLDHHPTPAADAAGGAYGNDPLQMQLPGGEEASASALEQQHQQQQPCFPTLDSWNVMYERTEML